MSYQDTHSSEQGIGELIYQEDKWGITVRKGKDFVCGRWRCIPILTVKVEHGVPLVIQSRILPSDYQLAAKLIEIQQRVMVEAMRLEPMVHNRSKSLDFA